MNNNDFTERLSKCYTGVIHDIMRDDGHKNFTLPPSIKPAEVSSSTFGKSVMVKLSAENKKMLYIPEGFAHGYLVLSEESIVNYKCTNIFDNYVY